MARFGLIIYYRPTVSQFTAYKAYSQGSTLTHSRRDLFRVFDIGFGQIGDILGIILEKELFKKSN